MKALRIPILLFAALVGVSNASAELAPNEQLSLVRLGMSYIEQWDLEKASEVLSQLQEDHKDETPVKYLQAQLLFHQGNYVGAKKVLQEMRTRPVLEGAQAFEALVDATIEATAGMVVHETEHFEIHYLPGKDDILVPYTAETLEKAYDRIGSDLGWKPTEKVRVEIYPDSDRFIAVTTLTKKEIETSGTIALCKFNRLMITSPRVLVRGYGYRDTLAHEYIHYLLSRKTNNQVPLWLHEGIAKFEESRWRSNRIADISPTSESLLAEALETGYFITFEQMYPSFAKLKRAEDTQLAFAQVATMVGMIVRKGGYPMLNRLLDELTAGTPHEEALQKVGGWKDTDALWAEWKVYLGERGLKKIPGLRVLKTELKDGEETEESEDLRAIDNEVAKKYVRLGDRLRKNRRYKASAYEYNKAKSTKPGFDPIIMHKLGRAQMLAGDLEQAAVTFSETLSVYPKYGPINRRLGEVYVSLKSYDKAREPLETAVSVNPFDPAVHALLAETYEKLGETELRKRELEVLSVLKGN